MAVLSSSQRQAVWSETMQELSSNSEAVAITKVELRAVVDDLDIGLNQYLTAMDHTGISSASAISIVSKLVGQRL